mgnify:CR=1 FL=1
MTEQQRAEYMAIVAGLAGSTIGWEEKPENLASWAFEIWFFSNEKAKTEIIEWPPA